MRKVLVRWFHADMNENRSCALKTNTIAATLRFFYNADLVYNKVNVIKSDVHYVQYMIINIILYKLSDGQH